MRHQRAILSASIAAIVTLSLATPSLLADTAASWGDNTYGQLGDGNPGFLNYRTAPFAIPSLATTTTAIAAGGSHSLALKGGAVFAWGYNGDGELGLGNTTDQSTPTAIPGTLASGVSAIAAGASHSLAIKGGAVFGWGYNFYGQVGNNSLVNQLTPTPLTVLTSNVTAIAGGTDHSLAIMGGAVYAWGRNQNGQLGINSTVNQLIPTAITTNLTSGVTDIAAGAYHSLAIKSGGLYAWGFNADGEVGNNSSANQLTPVAITGLTTGVTDVAAGQFHSLALQNGNVFAWGDNTFGQLGNGGTSGSLIPAQVLGLSNIIQIAATAESSYALASDGTLWVWGDNSFGELGLSDDVNFTYRTPTALTTPPGFKFTAIDVDAAGFHALALVPEPASLVMLALGTGSLFFRRRSVKKT